MSSVVGILERIVVRVYLVFNCVMYVLVGTSMRHRCKSITNFELMPQPPPERADSNPWPEYPRVYGVDYGHAEVRAVYGEDPRSYQLTTKEFKGDEQGQLKSIVTLDVKLENGKVSPIPGSEKEWPCELAILAMGFLSPEQEIIKKMELDIDQRNNISAGYGDFRTNIESVFAAGDCRRGQSLVVWAINEGRGAADAIETYFDDLDYLPTITDGERYAQ